MLPKLGLPTYGWPLRGYPLWPETTNAPPFFIRFNYATGEVFKSDRNLKEALNMTAETKGY